MCGTGNITLKCQYGIAEKVLIVWSVGSVFNVECLSTILGHTVLPRTTTYQVLVVDSCTNLRAEYHCTAVFVNGTRAGSNVCICLLQNVSKVCNHILYGSPFIQQHCMLYM